MGTSLMLSVCSRMRRARSASGRRIDVSTARFNLQEGATLEDGVEDEDVLDEERADDEHRPERSERELPAVRALDDEQRGDDD